MGRIPDSEITELQVRSLWIAQIPIVQQPPSRGLEGLVRGRWPRAG